MRGLKIFAVLLLLTACDDSSANKVSNARLAQGELGQAAASDVTNEKLAYRHDIDLEMSPAGVRLRYDRARDECIKNAQINCVLMSATINMGDPSEAIMPNAYLSVRLPHESVAAFEQDLVAPLPDEPAGGVSLRTQSTTAEDLTKAITDIERREAQLNDYRDRLTALSKRADAKVEDLVKIESELSSVQSQLEAIAAEKKGLNERVATELLNIRLETQPGLGSSLAPIIQTLHHAGQTLGQSTASALRFAIAALPWLPIVAFGLYMIGFAIRRWRRK